MLCCKTECLSYEVSLQFPPALTAHQELHEAMCNVRLAGIMCFLGGLSKKHTSKHLEQAFTAGFVGSEKFRGR